MAQQSRSLHQILKVRVNVVTHTKVASRPLASDNINVVAHLGDNNNDLLQVTVCGRTSPMDDLYSHIALTAFSAVSSKIGSPENNNNY